jgi:hypothetical protein
MVDFGNDGDDTNFSKLFVIDTILEKELFIFTSGLEYKEQIKRQKEILKERGVIKQEYDRSEIFLRVQKPVLRSVVYHYEEFEEMHENLQNVTNRLV